MVEIAGMKLLWSSDWDGYEVGYPEVLVVGLYTDGNGQYYYIDYEKDIVLEEWKEDDEYVRC